MSEFQYFLEICGTDPDRLEAVLAGCRRDGKRERFKTEAEGVAWIWAHRRKFHPSQPGKTEYTLDRPKADVAIPLDSPDDWDGKPMKGPTAQERLMVDLSVVAADWISTPELIEALRRSENGLRAVLKPLRESGWLLSERRHTAAGKSIMYFKVA